MRRDIEFRSGSLTLRGWLYLPDNLKGPAPCVIMTNGFSCLKEQSLDIYAEGFANAGLAVLLYDHRCLGASDGEPRQEVDPVLDRRDYRVAITYAQQWPEIDSGRIGIWGGSYSGGLVIEVAALDRRVKAVVAQVPLVSGPANLRSLLPAEKLEKVFKALDDLRKAESAGVETPVMDVVSATWPVDPTTAPHLIPGRRAHEFCTYHKRIGKAPNWRNEMTVRSVDYFIEFEPVASIARISPTPLLFIVATEDMTTPTDLALSAYNKALEPKELLLIPGDHFSPYWENEELNTAMIGARDFFLRHFKRRP
ncbi:MAG: alpha/beta hydrolase [Myxococcaceae bacterium]